ncbi:type IIL restriction-modification enzyme MmeI [Methylophilus sp. Q8]|uniref:type IIL restriction-modification enzyme MmeI n=1 Tax=Methylophilus sp. Q8 TaxID=1506586 RepID=UPI00064882E0|nr:type IIL restriction-modification enzyme MmeI [Methylophilus sp. Q8]
MNSPPRGDANKTVYEIASAAQRLNELRDNWLNPNEWVDWVITPEEEKADFPKRAVAKAGFDAELKKRTLTNLYNQRPAWLDNAHKALDAAVAKAYDWEDYTPEMPDEEILRSLLKLNLERVANQ